MNLTYIYVKYFKVKFNLNLFKFKLKNFKGYMIMNANSYYAIL